MENIKQIVQELEKKYAQQNSLISVLDHSIADVLQSFADCGQTMDPVVLTKQVFQECRQQMETAEEKTIFNDIQQLEVIEALCGVYEHLVREQEEIAVLNDFKNRVASLRTTLTTAKSKTHDARSALNAFIQHKM